ncbi:hypothetical protein [Paenibacillus paeoniae]|uniref:Chemotaxis methyl-accepting receptor HlyB-like 4HB MCP domain-containing protein n=1 Tax=Paenibacillus paeoniae TaxID=2292705 RepID=A0A371PMP5_9BACL|nr:hypothetical protein [Paenibacillus paeoniae]REK77413.1 hypothetical protein DX130_10570 [Paenibacillus paeoniae]
MINDESGGRIVEQQQNVKRSWALPITLVLLVFSSMGNILLYTKHIEHTRGNTVQTGESIFQGFKEGQEQLAHWSAYLEEVLSRAESEPSLARLTAVHMADGVAREHAGLAVLMEHAGMIDSANLGQAADSYAAYEQKLEGTLRSVGTGSGGLTETERQSLGEVQSSFVKLTELLSAFHFGMEGDRNSMIRLTGGHDWIDIAEELHKELREYTGA